jgi:hypothetical protein
MKTLRFFICVCFIILGITAIAKIKLQGQTLAGADQCSGAYCSEKTFILGQGYVVICEACCPIPRMARCSTYACFCS